jgi:Rieske Fe-S protein
MKTLLSSILFILLLFNSSCKSDNPYNIPYVPVNFYVYPNNIDSDLGVSKFKYFPQYGYRGIVVYRMGMDQFLAYDRACTFDSENTTAIIKVDPSGLFAACPVCGSRYELIDGYPIKGPAKNPLLQYQTTYNGNDLLISN